MVAQVQNQISSLVAKDGRGWSVRTLGCMACALQKSTYSHHRIAIKFRTTCMVAKGYPNKLTGGPTNF